VKVLYLLRHAKSSWDDPEIADHDRPLAPRGKRAARLIAGHLSRQGVQPALVLSSSARRARETLKPLERVFSGKVDVRFESGLYAASAPELAGRLRSVPAAVASVLVVGHNPGLQELGLLLARPSPNREALGEKFPAGALAVVELDLAGWHDLTGGSGELTSLVLPRELG
jgi:phosphohistidine phosphatase